jgi:hypothetical protein
MAFHRLTSTLVEHSGRHREEPIRAELKLYNTLDSGFHAERLLHHLIRKVARIARDPVPVVVRLHQ